jgi:hypothetical protein
MQSTFTFKQSTTIGIWLVPESDNFQSLLPTSSHYCQIPATFSGFWRPDSDETVWISAIVAGILPVSDLISSPMIFILFYINIYMMWIKINFYKLIWLNENIKNICDFPYAPNTEKCFRRKIAFLKPFYNANHFTSKQTKH